ncbi:hypothetical protein, partial [Amycolatopsis solani]|uniref:hypothetical protein n=1 Tax=Amycolatopsis solani TaxID=3028615 RepID=UPI0025AF66EF
DADHSGGYVIGAGDPMPCPARAGWGNVTTTSSVMTHQESGTGPRSDGRGTDIPRSSDGHPLLA